MKLSDLLPTRYIKNTRIPNLKAYGLEQYQDILVNGSIVEPASKGHDALHERYQLISRILNQYQRPFTLLDLGASQGYYSIKAASDYNCVAVMLEGDNQHYPMSGKQLLAICKANNTLNNLIHLNAAIDPHSIKRLSECECFDVVLALNIIHWFPEIWKQLIESIIECGNNIIIEVPPIHDAQDSRNCKIREDIHNYLRVRKATELGQVKRHTSNTSSTMYLVSNNKSFLKRKTWLMPEIKQQSSRIESSFTEKVLVKQTDNCALSSRHEWVAGINLITYLMLNGQHPCRSRLSIELETLAKAERHDDWTANNMIVNGNSLVLIDWPQSSSRSGTGRMATTKVVKKHKRLLKCSTQASVVKYFWRRLVLLMWILQCA